MATKKRTYFHLGLGIFWLVVLAWLFYNMQAHGVSASVLDSNNKVKVEQLEKAIIYEPAVDTMAAALIFYPGALVDPKAYTPLARSVAMAGFKIIIIRLPYRMAPFDFHKKEVDAQTLSYIEQDPKKRKWIIGGHSKGGKLAAYFADKYARKLDGLLLVGTSHPREINLSNLSLDVTKVYGSEDGLASEEEVDRYAPNLPDETYFMRIEGANHRQFGWYGYQLGDHSAHISRKEQQRITLDHIIQQLNRVRNR